MKSTFHHHASSARRESSGSCAIWIGILITAVGTVFLLDALNLLHGISPSQLWPGIFLLMGLKHLLRPHSVAGSIWGGLLLTGGVAGMYFTLNGLFLPWTLIWPSILIVIGICTLLAIIAAKNSGSSFSHKNECTLRTGVIESNGTR